MKDKDITKIFGVTLLNLMLSVVIPVALAYYKFMSEDEATLLGVLIWILFTSIESHHIISKYGDIKQKEQNVWDLQDKFDTHLLRIRNAYRRILRTKRNEQDLFQNFLYNAISDLDHVAVQAADRGELRIERGHLVSTDALLSSFTGEPSDIFRAVHFLEDNDFFFAWAKEYFYRVHELVEKKKIREVRRLFVYKSPDELRDPRTIRLAAFHSLTSGYAYKVMRIKDFRSFILDFRLDVPRDFGIYGDDYVYCARINVVDNIVGHWLNRPEDVERFIRLFDKCWESPLSFRLRKISIDSIDVQELFDIETMNV